MKTPILVLSLVLAHASRPALAADFEVHTLQPDVPTKAFEDAGIPTHPAPAAKSGAALPFKPAERDQWLERAGLTGQVKKWDALDRDLLVIRSRTLPEDRFISLYRKKLKPEPLKSLHAITAKEGKW